jgi:hypothetical protein
VADRWHLLNKLRDAYERLLARHTGQLREAAGTDQRGAASRSRIDRRARASTVGRITTRIFATAASVERPGWPAIRIRHRHVVEALCRLKASITAARRMACTFFGLVRYHDLDGFDHWLNHARARAMPDMRRIAAGLEADLSVVRAAFSSPWSSGQINRI